ncbi:glycosyltransferase [Streptococcus mutans]|uniref:glycosyltransferase family 2 protein n=1 Tax=Streptococcus mutans TaxID=1309 RepID=UPI0002B5AA35|nr:glycosyltransferase family 2 protein [Streptococcus mutans]EMB86112.1 putative glycosyltransferase [Streptococcus mutans N29]EMC50554.1 putative glycosyltransferase [Streptococcus mutans SA38]MCB5051948.1 glycosyltransferase [Streptococcus mutans]
MSLENSSVTVSIVCTVYNKGKWLAQTIDSLLVQRDVDFEVIVIDDASTDNSKEIIESFAEKHQDKIIPIYNEENLGITATWRKACLAARGQYIARCDGDDYWLDDHKLIKQVHLLEKEQTSKWCGTDINFVDSDGFTTATDVFSSHVIEIADSYEKMIATRGFTAPSTWLIARDLMLMVNDMLDEDIVTADDTFNIQLDLFKHTNFTFLPETTVAYRVNEGSDSRPQSFEALQNRFDRLLKTQFYYLDKYPDTNYKEILRILLERDNNFEKNLSQQDVIHSKVNSQQVTIYFANEGQNFSQENTLTFPLQYQDDIQFEVPEHTATLRIDLSELSSFYRRVALTVNEFGTEILPSFSNGDLIGNYVMFKDNDPQLIYDVSSIKNKSFNLSYVMFNVDDIESEDYIAKVLSQDIVNYRRELHTLKPYKAGYQQALQERDRYKTELEEMVIRYNSVIHSRRWTIPTKIINLFRRKK